MKGMKWGVRRTPAQLGRSSKKRASGIKARAKPKRAKEEETVPKKKPLSEMTDDEIRQKISRLEMEKKYKELLRSEEQTSKGKRFVMDVLEKSGKNVATQWTTYVMGTAINKAMGSEVVNPRKGQKDK